MAEGPRFQRCMEDEPMTRRIVTFNWVTADGYFAAPDGNLDWVVPDDEQVRAAVRDTPQHPALPAADVPALRQVLAARCGRLRHGSGSAPLRTTDPGARCDRDRPERDDEVRLLPDSEAGHLEELAPRARP